MVQKQEVKTILPVYAVQISDKVVMFDSNKLTGEMCEKISNAVGTIRGGDVDYAEDKFPMFENEPYEEWKKRTGKDVDNDFMSRKEGESIQAHILRLNAPKLGNHEFTLKLINWYAGETGQNIAWKDPVTGEPIREISWAEFKGTIYQKVREPLYKFFVEQGELPILELYSKRS